MDQPQQHPGSKAGMSQARGIRDSSLSYSSVTATPSTCLGKRRGGRKASKQAGLLQNPQHNLAVVLGRTIMVGTASPCPSPLPSLQTELGFKGELHLLPFT